jgi:hypothetical protein
MSIDVNLRDISAGFGSPTLHNANNASIEAAFTKALDRTSNAGDNALEIDLDMALHYIFNVKDGEEAHHAATYGQVTRLLNVASDLLAVLEEEQTATEGQTVFTLTLFDYVPAANNIAVYINGVRQSHGAYTETDKTTVTFSEGLTAGDKVVFLVNESATTTFAVEEAPNDGKVYARMNDQWILIAETPFFKVGCGEDFMEAGEPEAVAGDFAFLYPQGYSFN